MRNTSSSLRAELRYQHHSRHLLFVFGAALVAAVPTTLQLIGRAEHLLGLFSRSLDQAEQNGVTLEEALATPVGQTSEGGMNTVDNVLRFDYENAAAALNSLHPVAATVHALEFATFIVFPVLFAVYGIVTSTYDYRYQTWKVKVAAHGWPRILISKAGSLVLAIGVAMVTVVVTGLALAAVVGRFFAPEVPAELAGVEINRVGALLPGVAVALASCVFFGLVGLALGTIFRSAIAPLIGFLVVNFIVPILSPFDPRNLLSALGHQAFTFEGPFQLVEPRSVSPGLSALGLVAVVLALLALAWLLSARRSHYVT